jgi:ketosteroid isomerase-like protein
MAFGGADLIRFGLDAFARRDIEAWLECFDPAVEVLEDTSLPDAGSYRGPPGLLRWKQIMERNWAEFQVFGEAFVESGDDVVTLLHVRGRGRRSGIPIDGRFGSIFTVRGERVIRWRIFAGWENALEAARVEKPERLGPRPDRGPAAHGGRAHRSPPQRAMPLR